MAQATLSCPSGAIHLESDWGNAFDEHLALPVLIGNFPPDPLFTRVCPFGFFVSSGGLSFDRAPLYSRALGPFAIKI